MPRVETRIYASLPTASEKQVVRTQIFHGLPAPIQPRPSLTVADFAIEKGPKTRLMPIEDLLKPRGATSATAGWQSRLHLGPMPRGRKLRLVVGLIALVVTAYGSLPGVRASTPTLIARPIVVAPPPVIAAPRAPVASPATEVAPKAKRANKATTPRKAGDQLAAGELARAAKSYEQLAAASPHDPVYAEAARILRLRVRRQAP